VSDYLYLVFVWLAMLVIGWIFSGGFLAGCFAPIARPARGTPRNFRRAIGES
jgi:hypothetical protein